MDHHNRGHHQHDCGHVQDEDIEAIKKRKGGSDESFDHDHGHGHTHSKYEEGAGCYHSRPKPKKRVYSDRAFTVGIGGPVGRY